MRLCFFVWLGLVFLLEPAAAADIPFVFNESSNDVGRYDSDQLVNISASSPELAGVPPISAPENSEILLFPASRTYKTVGQIKNEFDYKVWQKKGMILFNQGRYNEALQAFDQSIQMNPKIAESWSYKGVVLLVTHQYREAIKCFDVATALEPSFTVAWNNKAEALYAMGRYDEAIKACDKAIQVDPRSAKAWYTKGRILKTKAKDAFANARKIEHEN
jgi:tetratricopeptide (TPR) repeat protein